MKRLLCVFFFAMNAFSQTFLLEGGANYFLGDMQKEIKIAPYGGAGIAMGLSHYTNGYLQGSYSYLKLKSNLDFSGLHQFVGRAGLESSEQVFKPVSVGIGISLAGIRGRAATPAAENYMLNSSESEFGWNARLRLNILRFEKFMISASFYYDQIWTKPKDSRLLHGGISLFLPNFI